MEKCRVTLKLREEAVRKARESSLRSESVTISPSMSTDPIKRRREMEKKKRIEEEAVIKVGARFTIEYVVLKKYPFPLFQEFVLEII